MEIITTFAEALQANPALLVAISLWEALFTLLALWFAARNDHKGWFVICGLIQLFGLVQIFYHATKTNFFKDFKLNGSTFSTNYCFDNAYCNAWINEQLSSKYRCPA